MLNDLCHKVAHQYRLKNQMKRPKLKSPSVGVILVKYMFLMLNKISLFAIIVKQYWSINHQQVLVV